MKWDPPQKEEERRKYLGRRNKIGEEMVASGSIRSKDLGNSPAKTHGDGKNLKGSRHKDNS